MTTLGSEKVMSFYGIANLNVIRSARQLYEVENELK